MRQAHPDFVMPGHVMRLDPYGITFVPRSSAQGAVVTGRRKSGGLEGDDLALRTAYRSKESTRELFPVSPIKKRTPLERTASMTQNLLASRGADGRPLGLSDEQVRELVGRSWQRGEPVTSDHVRSIAASLLEEAESKDNAAQAKKVVRRSPTD